MTSFPLQGCNRKCWAALCLASHEVAAASDAKSKGGDSSSSDSDSSTESSHVPDALGVGLDDDNEPKAKSKAKARARGSKPSSSGGSSSQAKAVARAKAQTAKMKEVSGVLQEKLAEAKSDLVHEKTKFRKWRHKNPDSMLAKEFKELTKNNLSQKVISWLLLLQSCWAPWTACLVDVGIVSARTMPTCWACRQSYPNTSCTRKHMN